MNNLIPAYAEWPVSQGAGLAHAGLMGVSWVFLMPLAWLLNGSRYTVPVQVVFLIFNLGGLCFGSYYTHSTPDLYKGNVHRALGWIVLVILLAIPAVSMIAKRRSKVTGSADYADSSRKITWTLRLQTILRGFRFRGRRNVSDADSGGHTLGLLGNSASQDNFESDNIENDSLDGSTDVPSPPRSSSTYDPHEQKAAQLGYEKHYTWRFVAMTMFLIFLGLALLISGLVVYAGLFRGKEIFDGLKHVIHGAIICFYGIFTLLIWTGSITSTRYLSGYAEDGDKVGVQSHNKATGLTERFLILLYGLVDILLQLVEWWQDPSSPLDWEGWMISLLFCGAGACGIFLQIPSITREFHQFRWIGDSGPELGNILPVIAFTFLGITALFHPTKADLELLQVDKLWGELLVGFGAARFIGHMANGANIATAAPLEWIASYCLITGGLSMAASARNVVHILALLEVTSSVLYATFSVFSVALMCWVAFVGGWARYTCAVSR